MFQGHLHTWNNKEKKNVKATSLRKGRYVKANEDKHLDIKRSEKRSHKRRLLISHDRSTNHQRFFLQYN